MPFRAINSLCVPSSAILPCAIHQYLVGILYASQMMGDHQHCLSFSQLVQGFFCIRCSFSGSAKAVASSGQQSAHLSRWPGPRTMRCCSPPERNVPSTPIFVFNPLGSRSMISRLWERSMARCTASSLAAGLPYLMFSSKEVLKSFVFWRRKRCGSSGCLWQCFSHLFRQSSHYLLIRPKSRGMSWAMVVFPPPDCPTRAKVFPSGRWKLIPSTAF